MVSGRSVSTSPYVSAMESNAVHQLTTIARTHHGLFRADDAEAAGVNQKELLGLTRSGWCERPRRGVYRVTGAPVTADQLAQAAVWFSGAYAVISHRSAARTWSIPGFGGAGPELTKPRGQSQRRSYGLVHGSLVLPSTHCTVHRSLPVTTVARTIFDLAGVCRPERVERALDHALSSRMCTLGQVQQVFFALARQGRRGTVTMRTLLEDRGEGYIAPASELERKGREVFSAHGLPMPTFEVDLGAEEWVGRVDCIWREQRVIVELDSRRHHTALLDRDSDRRRDNELMAAGWRVLRVTWDDLNQNPTSVARWIRSALASAAA